MQTFASLASRSSTGSYGVLPGLRTVVMPNASHARPADSPKSGCRCEWNSIRPGITVRFEASTTCPEWLASACGTTLVILLPSMMMSTLSRDAALFMSTIFPACTTRRVAGIAGAYFRSSGTVRVSPVSTSTIRSLSID